MKNDEGQRVVPGDGREGTPRRRGERAGRPLRLGTEKPGGADSRVHGARVGPEGRGVDSYTPGRDQERVGCHSSHLNQDSVSSI